MLPQLIGLHWRSKELQSPIVADVTYGGGRFWKACGLDIIGSDLDPVRAKTVCADFRFLPYKDSSIDVLIFDPPHIADVGSERRKIMREIYGIYWKSTSIIEASRAFLLEAARVLKQDGIIIAKLSDQIQTGRHFWNHFDYMNIHQDLPLTVCDIVIKIRKSPGPQPWDHQRHAWQRHCYFLVSRKGKC